MMWYLLDDTWHAYHWYKHTGTDTYCGIRLPPGVHYCQPDTDHAFCLSCLAVNGTHIWLDRLFDRGVLDALSPAGLLNKNSINTGYRDG